MFQEYINDNNSNGFSIRSIFLTLDISRVTYGGSKISKSFQLWTQNDL